MRYLVVLCQVASLLLFPVVFSDSHASPGMGGDKFGAADVNKDGCLNAEEFGAAFPGLKQEAFSLIDSDKNSCISREEWQAFSGGHGKNAHAVPQPEQQGALPLLPAPRQDPPPADGDGTNPGGALPLLSSPAKKQ